MNYAAAAWLLKAAMTFHCSRRISATRANKKENDVIGFHIPHLFLLATIVDGVI